MSTLLSVADCLKAGRYTLYRTLRESGVPTDRACLAVDVLLGPEPDDDTGEFPALEPDMELPGEESPLGDDDEWRPAAEETFQPGPEDWLDYSLWSERMATLEGLHRQEDESFARGVLS